MKCEFYVKGVTVVTKGIRMDSMICLISGRLEISQEADLRTSTALDDSAAITNSQTSLFAFGNRKSGALRKRSVVPTMRHTAAIKTWGSTLRTGELFAVECLFGRDSSPQAEYTALTVVQSEVGLVPRSDFDKLIAKDPDMVDFVQLLRSKVADGIIPVDEVPLGVSRGFLREWKELVAQHHQNDDSLSKGVPRGVFGPWV
jgi:Cyclic nucleotide-binding domain.